MKKIVDIIKSDKPSLSMEVFPPKPGVTFDDMRHAIEGIAELHPTYMSVTYGAGGGTSAMTADIAQDLQNRFSVPALAHLSCISATKEQICLQLSALRDKGVCNVLALRGDIPDGATHAPLDYRYAYELAEEIRAFGGFCIGGACYPEGHPESESSFKDIEYLRKKVECGCEYLTTQMFFDNNILYNFMYRLREGGVNVPVIAGIMPVTNPKQIKRICSISKNLLPQRFTRIVERYGDKPEAMKQAGIAYATEQIIDLFANGVNAVHVYSMNKPDVAASIMRNLSAIIA